MRYSLNAKSTRTSFVLLQYRPTILPHGFSPLAQRDGATRVAHGAHGRYRPSETRSPFLTRAELCAGHCTSRGRRVALLSLSEGQGLSPGQTDPLSLFLSLVSIPVPVHGVSVSGPCLHPSPASLALIFLSLVSTSESPQTSGGVAQPP